MVTAGGAQQVIEFSPLRPPHKFRVTAGSGSPAKFADTVAATPQVQGHSGVSPRWVPGKRVAATPQIQGHSGGDHL